MTDYTITTGQPNPDPQPPLQREGRRWMIYLYDASNIPSVTVETTWARLSHPAYLTVQTPTGYRFYPWHRVARIDAIDDPPTPT